MEREYQTLFPCLRTLCSAGSRHVSRMHTNSAGIIILLTSPSAITLCTQSPPRRAPWAGLQHLELVLSGVDVGLLREAVAGEEASEPYRYVPELKTVRVFT